MEIRRLYHEYADKQRALQAADSMDVYYLAVHLFSCFVSSFGHE